jgi:hypothetical protein
LWLAETWIAPAAPEACTATPTLGVVATSKSRQSRPEATIADAIASHRKGPLVRPSLDKSTGPGPSWLQNALANRIATSGVNSEPMIPRSPLTLMMGSAMVGLQKGLVFRRKTEKLEKVEQSRNL